MNKRRGSAGVFPRRFSIAENGPVQLRPRLSHDVWLRLKWGATRYCKEIAAHQHSGILRANDSGIRMP